MKISFRTLLPASGLLAAALLIGCGGEQPTAVAPNPAAAEIRMALTGVADTGQLDSGIVIVQAQIERLKEDDPGKASEIQPLYDELKEAKSPTDAKRLANEILGKL